MRRSALTVTFVVLSLLVGGCLNSSSTPSTDVPRAPSHQPLAKGTIEGRVFTIACGGPAAVSCAPHNYRGSLVFCKTMGQIGFCPSARVDGAGRYTMKLRPGRYALLPAPGKGNVVAVKPRWVRIAVGRTTTLNIDGGNLMS